MTIDIGFMALVIATVLLLPWSQKHADTWKKIQKWYKYLVAGVLFGLVPMVLYYYAPFDSEIVLAFEGMLQVLFETLAVVSGIIGIVGMCKSLLLEK
jgi:drug/metabolite transporter (DMT)-like permease